MRTSLQVDSLAPPLLCNACGAPRENRRSPYCDRCGSARRRARRAEHDRMRRDGRAEQQRRTYGAEYRRQRAAWARRVIAGGVLCARCGGPIAPGEPWDLGHVDGTERIAGPEHRHENRATNAPGRVTAASAQRVSRQW